MFGGFKVEHVTPAVLYLCSEQRRDTGLLHQRRGGQLQALQP